MMFGAFNVILLIPLEFQNRFLNVPRQYFYLLEFKSIITFFDIIQNI